MNIKMLFLLPFSLVLSQLQATSFIGKNVDNLNWYYLSDICGISCSEVCQQVGELSNLSYTLNPLTNKTLWLMSQNTTEKCENLKNVFGFRDYTLGSTPYACLQSHHENSSWDMLRCTVNQDCPEIQSIPIYQGIQNNTRCSTVDGESSTLFFICPCGELGYPLLYPMLNNTNLTSSSSPTNLPSSSPTNHFNNLAQSKFDWWVIIIVIVAIVITVVLYVNKIKKRNPSMENPAYQEQERTPSMENPVYEQPSSLTTQEQERTPSMENPVYEQPSSLTTQEKERIPSMENPAYQERERTPTIENQVYEK